MGTAGGAVFACLLGPAALLGRLEIRYLRRRDRDPEEDYRWPEWGVTGPFSTGEDRAWLVCGLCGKRSRRLNPREQAGRDVPPPEHRFP